MSNFLKKIICCPNCQKRLSIQKKSLNCLCCKKQYSLIYNIPIFLGINLKNLKKYKYSETVPSKSPFQYALHFQLYKKYLLKYLKPRREDVVLDVGCGLGHCLNFLNKFSGNLIGLDTDFLSLLYAQKTTKASYVLARGEKMPFKDNSFDKLINFNVLEHIQDDQSVIKEIVRVGKDKAKVLIIVPALEGPRTQSKLKRLMHTNKSGNEKHHRDGYYLKDIKNLLNKERVKVVTARYSMFLFAELFTELTKVFYSKKHKTYERQVDLFKVTNNRLFSLYKIIAPIIGKLAILEDLLFSHSKKGHALVIVGEIRK